MNRSGTQEPIYAWESQGTKRVIQTEKPKKLQDKWLIDPVCSYVLMQNRVTQPDLQGRTLDFEGVNEFPGIVDIMLREFRSQTE